MITDSIRGHEGLIMISNKKLLIITFAKEKNKTFNRSRKTHGFFMGHEFKHPHENPINSDTMKNGFSIHGFFIIIKKP